MDARQMADWLRSIEGIAAGIRRAIAESVVDRIVAETKRLYDVTCFEILLDGGTPVGIRLENAGWRTEELSLTGADAERPAMRTIREILQSAATDTGIAVDLKWLADAGVTAARWGGISGAVFLTQPDTPCPAAPPSAPSSSQAGAHAS